MSLPEDPSALLGYLARETSDRRYAWTRQMMTLATAVLTALIALQKTFVPEHPQALWLLQLAWGSLAVGIVLCAAHLRGDYQAYQSTAEDLQQQMIDAHPGKPSGQLVSYPGKLSQVAFRIYPWAFLLAVLAVTVFAILNLQTIVAEPSPPK